MIILTANVFHNGVKSVIGVGKIFMKCFMGKTLGKWDINPFVFLS